MFAVEHPPTSRSTPPSASSTSTSIGTRDSIHPYKGIAPKLSSYSTSEDSMLDTVSATTSTYTATDSPLLRDLSDHSFGRLTLEPKPVDLSKYEIISVFLTHLINMRDPGIILTQPKNLQFFKRFQVQTPPESNREILDGILFPADVWIRDEVSIKNVEIKVTMLNEINSMLESELGNISEQSSFEEITLSYYAKLLTAYKVYEVPTRSFPVKEDSFLQGPIDEECEEGKRQDDLGLFGKPFYRTTSNQSQQSSGSQSSKNSKNKRTSSTSSLGKKRLSSFLTNGNKHQPLEDSSTPHTPPHQPFANQRRNSSLSTITDSTSTTTNSGLFHSNSNSNSNHRSSSSRQSPEGHGPTATINSILSKSKIYNRMKKHRDSLASVASNKTQSSPLSPLSNRSSLSTAQTGATSVGSRRRSVGVQSINNSGAASVTSSAHTVTAMVEVISEEQRHENSKHKYDYYVQIFKLNRNTDKIMNALVANTQVPNEKLVKFLEFIKEKLLKFIIVDVMFMILSYAEAGCSNFSNLVRY
ncbi:uncharacterized protein LODBEIA_P60210 [Lodderomyces beijingensis]|uniref:RGS domain-containing protein n=1 Tax=Lodderomyces beijingensis TaxID=1775926 RepID=A0ABP0ZVV2_9ASCO